MSATTTTTRTTCTATTTTPTPATTPTETADQILTRAWEQFMPPILHFLWASEELTNDITPPTSSPLQDEDTIAWELKTRNDIYPLLLPL